MWIAAVLIFGLVVAGAVALCRGGRWRFLVLNSLIVCASLALAAGGTEAVVRLTSAQKYHPLVPSAERGLFWQYDARLGWSHRPGSSGRFQKPGVFDTAVTINSTGFRGREYAERAAAGVLRIVVLGDSIVWGYGVEDDEVFTNLVEQDRPDVEMINLGVSGYGTDQESLLLEREGMRYRPEIVLAEVCENDFEENIRDQVYHIYPKPLFKLEADGSVALTNDPVPPATLLDRLLYRLESGSYLWRLLRVHRASAALIERVETSARRLGLSRAVPGSAPSPGAAEAVLLALLRRTKKIAEAGGAHLTLFAVAPMSPAHRELVRRFGEEQGVEVIDLNSSFQKALAEFGGPSLFLRGDLHWTPAGHRLVARVLEEWLALSGSRGQPRGGLR